MKIGIDARMYGPKQGGLGRYIEQLILNLEQIDIQNQYVIFLRRENWNEFEPKNQNFKKVKADIGWYGFAEQFKLPSIIKKEKIDLMHFPHWNVPIFYNQNFIVTIHDLLLLHYPTRQASTLGPLLYWLKNKLFRITLNHAAKKSQKILTISEFSKNDIVKTLAINSKKIDVTYLAPRHIVEGEKPPFSLFDKYKIHKPYWLYVGVAYPHKNLEKLIDGWKIFYNKNSNYQLVIVGKTNYFYKNLTNYIKQNNVHDVILTDFVPDDQLPEFYKNASLYVFPSLHEGFGLPPLEAMQYNLPVISSSKTCLPEILGNSALFFDPNDAHEIAHCASVAIHDQNTRTNLIENGKNILKKYSWNKTAVSTLEIYNSITKNR